MIRPFCAVFTAALLGTLPAAAHRFIPNDGSHDGPNTALIIQDTTLSQVVYHEIGPDQSENLWLRFAAGYGQELFVQIGVPRLDRLEDYRPAVALIGPGLGADEVPFEVPEAMGVRVLDTADVAPEEFDEEFTATESWILLEQTVTLPENGTYSLVAFDPAGNGGKMYVAVGQREAFGWEDLVTYRDVLQAVRTFHEVVDEPLPLLPTFLNFLSYFANAVSWILGL